MLERGLLIECERSTPPTSDASTRLSVIRITVRVVELLRAKMAASDCTETSFHPKLVVLTLAQNA